MEIINKITMSKQTTMYDHRKWRSIIKNHKGSCR